MNEFREKKNRKLFNAKKIENFYFKIITFWWIFKYFPHNKNLKLIFTIPTTTSQSQLLQVIQFPCTSTPSTIFCRHESRSEGREATRYDLSSTLVWAGVKSVILQFFFKKINFACDGKRAVLCFDMCWTMILCLLTSKEWIGVCKIVILITLEWRI